MIIIYCPCKNKDEAKKIAKSLVNNKLAACINIVQSDSIYRWQGKICNGKENIMLIKTKRINEDKVKKEIRKLHSYELPAIITINCKANKEFENWVDKQIK